MIDFSDNLADIKRAMQRWVAINGAQQDYHGKVMDLCAADGVNGNQPLDWEALLAADAWQFCHDVGGIFRHIDRSTGKLGDCFSPRHVKTG